MSEIDLERAISMSKVSVPRHAPSVADWVKFESDLNIKLPSDFKKLISTVGDGFFGELRYINPHRASRSIATDAVSMIELCESFEYIGSKIGQRIYPDPVGLIPIATLPSDAVLFLDKISIGEFYRVLFVNSGLFVGYELKTNFCKFIYDVFVMSKDLPNSDLFHRFMWEAECVDSTVFFNA